MTKSATAPTLADWLASASDERLGALLRRRPDLTIPPPGSTRVLATRAEQRASVLRAAEELDTADMTVLEVLALAEADSAPVTVDEVIATVTERAKRAGLRASAVAPAARRSIQRLLDLALVYGPSGTATRTDAVRMVSAARTAIPWRIGRFVETPVLTPAAIAEGLAAIATEEGAATAGSARKVLDTLAGASPIGQTRDAAPGAPADAPVPRLLRAGLLIRLDDRTVELPVQVGQYLRGETVVDPADLADPLPDLAPRADIDATAAGEAQELIRDSERLLDALGSAPAPVLKAGGLGVRELRRLARTAAVDEERTGLLIEILAGAGLIAAGSPEPLPDGDQVDDFWAPTVAADGWFESDTAHRWAVLARAWLHLPRQPGLIGGRDSADKPIAALSDEVRSPAAARERGHILATLAEFGVDGAATPGELAAVLRRRRPRIAGRFSTAQVERIVREATAVAVIAHNGLSNAGRALLAENPADEDTAAATVTAMDKALPAPVDHVLVQADLTVIAPGPLVGELAERMTLLADIESAGAATMYRLSEASLRRGLDAGLTADRIHAFFAAHSRTPVPQSLEYLIDDIARRHGRLRAGVASAFVRCDDPALLTEVLNSPAAAELALRPVAATVAISQAPLAEVLDLLRRAGFAPAGEDSSGAIVDLRPRAARVHVRRARPAARGPAVADDTQLNRMIREIRAGDRATQTASGSRITGAQSLAALQAAAKAQRSVTIGYVDAHGTAHRRVVDPVAVGGGRLEAFDAAAGAMRTFALHRITDVADVD